MACLKTGQRAGRSWSLVRRLLMRCGGRLILNLLHLQGGRLKTATIDPWEEFARNASILLPLLMLVIQYRLTNGSLFALSFQRLVL